MPSNQWSRGEKLTAIGVVIAMMGTIAALFVVPEFRRIVHLDRLPLFSSQPDSLRHYKKLLDEYNKRIEELKILEQRQVRDQDETAKLRQEIKKLQTVLSRMGDFQPKPVQRPVNLDEMNRLLRDERILEIKVSREVSGPDYVGRQIELAPSSYDPKSGKTSDKLDSNRIEHLRKNIKWERRQ